MEKIPAASAIEWSIELEKGLRSKKPGKKFCYLSYFYYSIVRKVGILF